MLFYSHLKMFGCKSFAHAPKKQQSKLDDKAMSSIFVGYGGEEFGYMLCNQKKRDN